MTPLDAKDAIGHAQQALAEVKRYEAHIKAIVRKQICREDGSCDGARLTEYQYEAHGYGWIATYHETLRQMLSWAQSLNSTGSLSPVDALIVQCLFGEYCAQLKGGLPMNQQEFIRPSDFCDKAFFNDESSTALMARARSRELTQELTAQLQQGNMGHSHEGDDMLSMVRDQFRRFSEEEIKPHAATWHGRDELIPMEVINQMAELGVFGIAIDEKYGGLSMGKMAMCLVTEELSRGFLAAGSLGTRAEIAAELIHLGGTDEQKQHWLPRIASGETLTTAVFTEPNVGSDLGSLATRAEKQADGYHIYGAKTWITHGARSDLMTLLARTNKNDKGYRGLSMFLAEKTRGTNDNPFPNPNISGSEIEVLGYRGMKEYEIAFDDFVVPQSSLLGGEEGMGFKQLMATFESARIQTAARAVGVAQAALELAVQYASERTQFGHKLLHFPRIAAKLALMASEVMAARQVTFFSAREKDEDKRCDIEAGMAKLLAARVAWSNADSALQIHGGNGYALEYEISRVLCDARILNIFEGAAEIQAQVVVRGLVGR